MYLPLTAKWIRSGAPGAVLKMWYFFARHEWACYNRPGRLLSSPFCLKRLRCMVRHTLRWHPPQMWETAVRLHEQHCLSRRVPSQPRECIIYCIVPVSFPGTGPYLHLFWLVEKANTTMTPTVLRLTVCQSVARYSAQWCIWLASKKEYFSKLCRFRRAIHKNVVGKRWLFNQLVSKVSKIGATMTAYGRTSWCGIWACILCAESGPLSIFVWSSYLFIHVEHCLDDEKLVCGQLIVWSAF